jgi:DNA invertase Pin-like site-specific DNA recombinase
MGRAATGGVEEETEMEDRVPEWMQKLEPREFSEVRHCQNYTIHPFGTDGHGRMLVVAKLAAMLDEMERELVALRSMNLLTPAKAPDTSSTRPPDTSKRPKGFT